MQELFDINFSASVGGRKIAFCGGKNKCEGIEGSYKHLSNYIARSFMPIKRCIMIV